MVYPFCYSRFLRALFTQSNLITLTFVWNVGFDEVLDQYSSSPVCSGWSLDKHPPHCCWCRFWPVQTHTFPLKGAWWESSSESMKGHHPCLSILKVYFLNAWFNSVIFDYGKEHFLDLRGLWISITQWQCGS